LLQVLSIEEMAVVDQELKTTQAELDEKKKELKLMERGRWLLQERIRMWI